MTMMPRLKQYIRQEWLWLKLSFRFRWAHHPTCDPYSSQRFDVFGVSLCQGCTLVTLGILVGITFALIIHLSDLVVFAIIALAGLVTVGLVDGLRLSRPFKRVARVVLGHAIGTGLAQLILQNWILKALLGFLFVVLWHSYRYFRNLTPSKDLCQTCPELKEAPRCSGIISQFEANLRYQEQVLPVVDDAMIRRLEQQAASTLEDQKLL